MSILTTDGRTLAGLNPAESLETPMGGLPAEALWHNSTPAAVRKKWESKPDAAWSAFTAGVRGARPPLKELGKAGDCLAWGLGAQAVPAGLAAIAAAL
ncbi:MAG: hypothetical protein AAGB00_02940, partial [Planctomycetota bacterium]